MTSSLVSKYIKQPNMIVLNVVPATDDFTNSAALRIVKEEKAESRCIGVATKCDMVPEEHGETDIIEKLRMSRANDVQASSWFFLPCP